MKDIRAGDIWTGVLGGSDRWRLLKIIALEDVDHHGKIDTLVTFTVDDFECSNRTGIGAFEHGVLIERDGVPVNRNPGRPCGLTRQTDDQRCHLPLDHAGKHDFAPWEVTRCWQKSECILVEGHESECRLIEGYAGRNF